MSKMQILNAVETNIQPGAGVEFENPNGPDPQHDPDTGGLVGPLAARRETLTLFVTLLGVLGLLAVAARFL